MTDTLAPGDDPAAIEQDIARTRADMSNTIDALEERLSPREVANSFFSYLKEAISADEGSRHMINAIKQNPIPAALVAVGVGWLVLASKNSGGASAQGNGGGRRAPGGDYYDDAVYGGDRRPERGVADTARDYLSEGKDQARRYAADAEEKFGEVRDQVRERAQDVRDKAHEYSQQARDYANRFAGENPLTLGAVGFVVGAALGAVLPGTRIEREYVGDAADELVHRAEDAGRDLVDQAEEVAANVGEAAADALKKATGPREASARPAQAIGTPATGLN